MINAVQRRRSIKNVGSIYLTHEVKFVNENLQVKYPWSETRLNVQNALEQATRPWARDAGRYLCRLDVEKIVNLVNNNS